MYKVLRPTCLMAWLTGAIPAFPSHPVTLVNPSTKPWTFVQISAEVAELVTRVEAPESEPVVRHWKLPSLLNEALFQFHYRKQPEQALEQAGRFRARHFATFTIPAGGKAELEFHGETLWPEAHFKLVDHRGQELARGEGPDNWGKLRHGFELSWFGDSEACPGEFSKDGRTFTLTQDSFAGWQTVSARPLPLPEWEPNWLYCATTAWVERRFWERVESLREETKAELETGPEAPDDGDVGGMAMACTIL